MFTPQVIFKSKFVFGNCVNSTSHLKEKLIKIGKYNVNYLKVGNGSHNILLTPGTLGTIWNNYKEQILGFDLNKFSLVIFDPPGYGKSIPPKRQLDKHSYERDADIGAELMKILNINKYSLLGYSAGGTASLIHAAKYKDAVLNLVVSGAIAFALPHEMEVYRKTKDLSTWADDMKEPMIKEYGEEKLAEYWADWIDRMEIVFKSDQDICTQIVCDIECPTLIMHGGKDRLVDKTHVQFLKSQIKNSTTYLYPEGRHNIHMQYPEDFNNRVQDFLLNAVSPESSATTSEQMDIKKLSSKI